MLKIIKKELPPDQDVIETTPISTIEELNTLIKLHSPTEVLIGPHYNPQTQKLLLTQLHAFVQDGVLFLMPEPTNSSYLPKEIKVERY